MTTFARTLFLVFSLATTVAANAARAHSDQDTLQDVRSMVSARFDGKVDALKDYVPVTVAGFNANAYALKDTAARADNNQPAVLIFDETHHVVAIAYARPAAGNVTIMSMTDFSISNVAVTTRVAAR